MKRCEWCISGDANYIKYHDEEWGVPNHDDYKHFEFLILEGAQAGLSWSTILKRRNGYKTAFKNYDFDEVVKMTDKDIERLRKDEEIIRNKLKIKSVLTNAKAFIKVREEFGSFDKYVWNFVKNKPIVNSPKSIKEVAVTTKESDALSKDLKKRGFSFVGSTIMYAYMQAMGLVNDHEVSCFRYNELLNINSDSSEYIRTF